MFELQTYFFALKCNDCFLLHYSYILYTTLPTLSLVTLAKNIQIFDC